MTTPIAPGTGLPVASSIEWIKLAGRAGYNISLEPGGDAKQYAWDPEVPHPSGDGHKSLATDLDVQVMWVDAVQPVSLNPPLVYWRAQYGHGEQVYVVPQPNSFAPQGSPRLFQTQRGGWLLPNRGMRVRLPSRELRLYFWVPPAGSPPPDGEIGGGPCTLQVSAQPCDGVHAVQLPTTDHNFGGDSGVPPIIPSQFPLGATEFRIADGLGLPFAAAAGSVEFFDITGASLGPSQDLTLYGDWRVIPIFAAFWLADLAAQVSFR